MNRPDAILLAGGLGTRLSTEVPGLPKALAPVAGRPFLAYLLEELQAQGLSRVILSLGHRAKQIQDFLKDYRGPLHLESCLEPEPLGTGGAIALAMKLVRSPQAFVLNADTLFRIRLESMEAFHSSRRAEVTLALKPMEQADRYGLVDCEASGRIRGFEEKRPGRGGLINAGIYLIRRSSWETLALPERFSFERDFLEARCAQGGFYGFAEDAYFIDIGVPEDYRRAQQDFPGLFSPVQPRP